MRKLGYILLFFVGAFIFVHIKVDVYHNDSFWISFFFGMFWSWVCIKLYEKNKEV